MTLDRESLLWLGYETPSEMLTYAFQNLVYRQTRLFFCGCLRKIWPLLTDNRSRSAVIEMEDKADTIANLEEYPIYSTLVDCLTVPTRFTNQYPYTQRGSPLITSDYAQWCAAEAVTILARNLLPFDTREVMSFFTHIRRAEILNDEWILPPTTSHLMPEVTDLYFDILNRKYFMDPHSSYYEHMDEDELCICGHRYDKHLDTQFKAINTLYCGIYSCSCPRFWPNRWNTWNSGTIPSLSQHMYNLRDFSTMSILGDALEEAGCQDSYILSHCRHSNPHIRGCWVIDAILGKR